jgi:hypothetical protein
MHDNTNVPMRNPSDAGLNRALYSKYSASAALRVASLVCSYAVDTKSRKLCTGGVDASIPGTRRRGSDAVLSPHDGGQIGVILEMGGVDLVE